MAIDPDQGLVVHAGPLSIDVPRSVGFFGAVGLATAVGLIEPPLGLFIAAVPVLKMLTNPQAPRPVRFVGEVFDGAAKPVGGDAEGTIRLDDAAAARASRTARTARPPRAKGR